MNDPSDLSAALRNCAAGLLPLEAGTGLLIANGTFLHRDDFTSRFIEHGTSNGTPMAAIDWDAAITALHGGRLPCSGGERRILQLAASLAGGIPVDLRDTATGLDSDNTDRLVAAILHASGNHQGTAHYRNPFFPEARLASRHSSASSKETALSQPSKGIDNGPRESPLMILAPSEVEVARDREKIAGRISDMNPFGPPGSNGSSRSKTAPSTRSSQSEFANTVTHPADITTRTSEAPDSRASPAMSVAASTGW
jgi:hypothetical protein